MRKDVWLTVLGFGDVGATGIGGNINKWIASLSAGKDEIANVLSSKGVLHKLGMMTKIKTRKRT